MPRPKLAIRSVEKNISIPEDLAAQVDLELFSDIEGKVPFGAWKGFITRIIRQHLERRQRAEDFARRMELLAAIPGDLEARHLAMDRLLVDELIALGYHQGTTIYHNTKKWYA